MEGSRPVIGITCGTVRGGSNGDHYGQRANYAEAIQRAGGLVVLLVPDRAEPTLDLLSRLDGLLLPGGADVDPMAYGEARLPECGPDDAGLDALELGLVRLASERGTPLLGVCRGQQAINVALGGSLYQDIGTQLGSEIDHRAPRGQPGDFLAHDISLLAGSHLANVLGARELRVNSTHHQAVKVVAPGLRQVAQSPDGVVEGLESSDGHILALQCHPERLQNEAWAQNLFEHFVAQAGAARA
ncbi:MAG TPA: gamma-glutamyl-gamma-aminobutyrate hydrolase family protein [Chloroflexota bacterium]|nr:gamma-glutamyl-gamma-aminobutyrate hydrolase family protein [Chloroflexota bacterium]